ncbi:MAG: hypothetical protein SOZ23_00550 [Methanosphaera sp.]|uniref:hypothetical protein n=1 Tax=Methanosphaera sp. TaxID=2666342 RepID=UPI0025D0D586|nr:hypothetical protein [Methanosphaera sp.]MCI5866824.1 hypothetical protein [Methanosphaera sp.]MDD6534331.1 hypothetical protein [Methanosphaera sp.]MDY3955264.1 hypothetical protein [Methanosphaera sp.]
MNRKGYFLVYDMIFAIVILAVVVMFSVFIYGQMGGVESNTKINTPGDVLEILDSRSNYDTSPLENLAYKIDENEDKTHHVSEINKTIHSYTHNFIFSYEYRNMTHIILNETDNEYKNTYTSKKIIGEYTFQLTIFD